MKKYSVAGLLFVLIVMATLACAPCGLATNAAVAASVGQSEKLVFVVTVLRHGDRTPFAQLVNDPHTWTEGASQLTAMGMQQQFKLGKYLRKRYVEQFPLLDTRYKNDSIYALANGMNRTIQSAQCLLFGLYPLGYGPKLAEGAYALPSGYQPIPLRTVPKGSSLLMKSYPEYQKILKRYVFNAPEWLKKENAYKEKFKEWQNILGNNVEGLDDVLTIGDVLIVRKAHGIPRPKGLSQQNETEIIDLCEWALAFQFRNEKVSQVMGGQLFEEIKQDLEQASKENNTTKFKLYSGHDTTILPLMKLMGKELMVPPQYAAHTQIELYRSGKEYIVRLRYEEKNIQLPVMTNGSCSLNTFLAL